MLLDSKASPTAVQSPADETGEVEFLLHAERRAEEEVAAAERAAQASLEGARQEARRIAARTDERIAALGARAAESVDGSIELMRQKAEAHGVLRRRPLTDASHMARAIERIADSLLCDDAIETGEAHS